MFVPAAPLAREVWLPGGTILETVMPLRDAFPEREDETEEIAPFERLMRRHAAPPAPELTIDEEIELAGIEDHDLLDPASLAAP